MNILDKPAPFNGSNISLPLYHRGHVSLFPGAKVWLCLLPGNESSQQPTELVISPIKHDAWSDLWRISITLKERVGLVHDVFRILSANSFNIVTAESATKDWMKLHSIEIIANARLYINPLDQTSEERSTGQWDELEGLRAELLARLIDDVALLPNGEPRLRIRRVRSLLNARQSYNEAVAHFVDSEAARPIVRESKVVKLPNKRVVITLPKELQESIRVALGSVAKDNTTPYGRYLTISNTSERFIHVYFMKDTDSIISPTIEHLNEIGALTKITAAIQNAGFNILTTLSRPYEWETKAHTEFVLQPPQSFLAVTDQGKIKRHLEQALSTHELVNSYGLRVGYPVGYVTPFKTKKLKLKGNGKQIISNPTKNMSDGSEEQPSINKIISSKKRKLDRRRVNRGELSIDARLRYQILEELELDLQGFPGPPQDGRKRGRLFISYSFKETDLISHVTKVAKRQHFEVVLAKNLGRAETTREGIMAIMEDCTHFLGIWTEEGGTKVDGGFFPSPWLHWEWGVADAMGLIWRLLISSKIDEQAWSRIAGSTPHNIFTTASFEEQLKNALRLL